MSEKSIMQFSVRELRLELEKRNMRTSGVKAVLIERLKNALAMETPDSDDTKDEEFPLHTKDPNVESSFIEKTGSQSEAPIDLTLNQKSSENQSFSANVISSSTAAEVSKNILTTSTIENETTNEEGLVLSDASDFERVKNFAIWVKRNSQTLEESLDQSVIESETSNGDMQTKDGQTKCADVSTEIESSNVIANDITDTSQLRDDHDPHQASQIPLVETAVSTDAQSVPSLDSIKEDECSKNDVPDKQPQSSESGKPDDVVEFSQLNPEADTITTKAQLSSLKSTEKEDSPCEQSQSSESCKSKDVVESSQLNPEDYTVSTKAQLLSSLKITEIEDSPCEQSQPSCKPNDVIVSSQLNPVDDSVTTKAQLLSSLKSSDGGEGTETPCEQFKPSESCIANVVEHTQLKKSQDNHGCVEVDPEESTPANTTAHDIKSVSEPNSPIKIRFATGIFEDHIENDVPTDNTDKIANVCEVLGESKPDKDDCKNLPISHGQREVKNELSLISGKEVLQENVREEVNPYDNNILEKDMVDVEETKEQLKKQDISLTVLDSQLEGTASGPTLAKEIISLDSQVSAGTTSNPILRKERQDLDKPKTKNDTPVEVITLERAEVIPCNKNEGVATSGKSKSENTLGPTGKSHGSGSSNSSSRNESPTLLVKGLTKITCASDLKGLFRCHAKVLGVKIISDLKDKSKNPFAHITVSTLEGALSCIKNIHNREFNGGVLSVSIMEGKSFEYVKPETARKSKVDSKQGHGNCKDKTHTTTSDTSTSRIDRAMSVEVISDEELKIESDSGKKSEKHKPYYTDKRYEGSNSRGKVPRNPTSSFHHRSRQLDRRTEKRRHRVDDRRKFAKRFKQEEELKKLELEKREERKRRAQDEYKRREKERRQNEIELHNKMEFRKLEKEKERLRREREKIEIEKLEVIKLEKLRQQRERERIEKEKIEIRQAKLKLAQKRSFVTNKVYSDSDSEDTSERKKSRHGGHRVIPPSHSMAIKENEFQSGPRHQAPHVGRDEFFDVEDHQTTRGHDTLRRKDLRSTSRDYERNRRNDDQFSSLGKIQDFNRTNFSEQGIQNRPFHSVSLSEEDRWLGVQQSPMKTERNWGTSPSVVRNDVASPAPLFIQCGQYENESWSNAPTSGSRASPYFSNNQVQIYNPHSEVTSSSSTASMYNTNNTDRNDKVSTKNRRYFH